MPKKNILIKLLIILIIFIIGFFLRVDSINLYGISEDEKAYYQGIDELPYMYEMDSYFIYRITQNYLNHGNLGDKKINGTEWDLHSYYPPGVPVIYPPLIVYLTAFIYKLVNYFSTTPLLKVCFWLPAFIAPLCGIPAYLFVSKYSNNYGGLIAGILAVTIPNYFLRTVPGRFDTDIFIILFPILISWTYIESINNINKQKSLIYALLASLFTFLFSLAWNGWTYIFYLIIATSFLYLFLGKLLNKSLSKFIIIFTIFLASTLLLIYIDKGLFGFKIFSFPFMFLKATIATYYPTGHSSVAELEKPSIYYIIRSLGPFLITILFVIFLNILIFFKNKQMIKKLDKPRNLGPYFYLFIITWILLGFISLIWGKRFIMFLIPPLSIMSGFLIGFSIENLKLLNIKTKITNTLSLIIIFFLILSSLSIAHESSYSLFPGVNDYLWNGSEWINYNTDPNTIVISHWSYGYFFEAIANRPAIYDGGSQQSPREYWVDHALTTTNESLSQGIFRMLSTSGDLGYLTLENYTKDTGKSVAILNSILGVDKAHANEILITIYHFSEKQSEEVLKYTHPINQSPYIIVTCEDLINAGNWIFYYGTWDFNKKEGIYYNYSYDTITIDKSILKTNNGLIMNLDNKRVMLNGEIPYCVAIINNDHLEKRYLNNKSNNYIVINLDTKNSVVLDKRFENSIFTKLIIERDNSTIYKPIYKNKGVIIWKPQIN